jgi:hypothetical protein
MFVKLLVLTALLTLPAIPVFYAESRFRGGRRLALIALAVLICWILLYVMVDTGERAAEARFGRLNATDPNDIAPGHGEARAYAMIGGWAIAIPYVVWLVFVARSYTRSNEQPQER